MSESFLDAFCDLNADLAMELPAAHSPCTLLELASDTSGKRSASSRMSELMRSLSRQKVFPVLYILDEHNEMFKVNSNGNTRIEEHLNFLRGFTQWTGFTSGVSDAG